MNKNEINSLLEKLHKIEIPVGGCAVLLQKSDGGKYFFVERVDDVLYMINSTYFYFYDDEYDFEKMELLFKSSTGKKERCCSDNLVNLSRKCWNKASVVKPDVGRMIIVALNGSLHCVGLYDEVAKKIVDMILSLQNEHNIKIYSLIMDCVMFGPYPESIVAYQSVCELCREHGITMVVTVQEPQDHNSPLAMIYEADSSYRIDREDGNLEYNGYRLSALKSLPEKEDLLKSDNEK